MRESSPLFGTLTGLDHIGVGVSDMDASLGFYAELGFIDVAFDYTGPLPGLATVTGLEDDERARRLPAQRQSDRARTGSASSSSRSRPTAPAPSRRVA